MRRGEKKLIQLLKALGPEQQQMVVAFAEFLAGYKPGDVVEKILEPQPIPRPENESVVKAIKRLMETYPMLDRGKLLHETSHYMAQHVVQGRPAVEVIEELEVMFERRYKKFRESKNNR